MLPQTVALPHKPDAAVKALTVRALHNDGWIAFLIEWKDPTLSDTVILDNFGDQVAVELPVDAKATTPPSPMMGNPGGRVTIMQWRAAFQRDIDDHPPTIRDLYPNAWTDIYPDEVLGATDARPYTGALGVENPISRGRASPVLDQMAEGWGSMTVKPDQHALGKGVWKDGTWRVVITRPMVSDDVNAPTAPRGRPHRGRLRGVGGWQPRGRLPEVLVAVGAAGHLWRSGSEGRQVSGRIATAGPDTSREGEVARALARASVYRVLAAAFVYPSPSAIATLPDTAERAASTASPEIATKLMEWAAAARASVPVELAHAYVAALERARRLLTLRGKLRARAPPGRQGDGAGRHRRLLRGVRRDAEHRGDRGPHRGGAGVHERAGAERGAGPCRGRGRPCRGHAGRRGGVPP